MLEDLRPNGDVTGQLIKNKKKIKAKIISNQKKFSNKNKKYRYRNSKNLWTSISGSNYECKICAQRQQCEMG